MEPTTRILPENYKKKFPPQADAQNVQVIKQLVSKQTGKKIKLNRNQEKGQKRKKSTF